MSIQYSGSSDNISFKQNPSTYIHTNKQSFGPQLTLYKIPKESQHDSTHPLLVKILMLNIQIGRLHIFIEALLKQLSNKELYQNELKVLVTQNQQLKGNVEKLQRQKVRDHQQYQRNIYQYQIKLNEIQINRRTLQWKFKDRQTIISQLKSHQNTQHRDLQHAKLQQSRARITLMISSNQQLRKTMLKQKQTQISNINDKLIKMQQIIQQHKNRIFQLSLQNQQLRKRQIQMVIKQNNENKKYNLINQSTNTNTFDRNDLKHQEQIRRLMLINDHKHNQLNQLNNKINNLQLINRNKRNQNSNHQLGQIDIIIMLQTQINRIIRQKESIQTYSKKQIQNYKIQIQILNKKNQNLNKQIQLNQTQFNNKKSLTINNVYYKKQSSPQKLSQDIEYHKFQSLGSHINKTSIQKYQTNIKNIIENVIKLQQSNRKVKWIIQQKKIKNKKNRGE